mmetsp:Transcript_11882/g.14839  ORF Transcript_11882/g.14839 Transcript_11882/m.14839 type:complete len:103 (+) Transcript_11882:566-874(+)
MSGGSTKQKTTLQPHMSHFFWNVTTASSSKSLRSKAFPASMTSCFFFRNEPTDVGEKQSPRDVVRVGVGFGVFVMDAVIARPVVYGALIRDGGEDHEEDADW